MSGEYAGTELAKFDLDVLDRELLRWLAIFPHTQDAVFGWVNSGKLKKLQSLGVDFLKAMAFQPDWDSDPWLAAFKNTNGQWAKELAFDENRAEQVLNWFRDVRKVTAAELGFDWLMRLVTRAEPMYHDFASDRLIRTFLPSDFAPTEVAATGAAPAAADASDLQKASFLFTGKLSSMTRDDAEGKVKAANGTVAGSGHTEVALPGDRR